MNSFASVRSFPLTSRRGLEQMYREQVQQPDLPTPAKYKKLSEEAREELDERRIRFIHHGLTVSTPALGEATKLLGMLYVQNRDTVHDKLSLGLSGAPYLGKSHSLFELARYTANSVRRYVPDFIEQEIIPSVVITVPSPTSSKGVLQEIMTFYGYDFHQGYTESKLRSIVVQALNEHGTRMIGFDEAHNMARSGPRLTEDTKNMLRKLMQDTVATQVYSGIELHLNGLFKGVSGRQLSSRIRMVELHPYTAANAQSRELWMKTLDRFEEGLCLVGNEPGTLRSLAAILYNRTGGVIGELANVLRTAAVLLIRRKALLKFGREQITEVLLDEIPLGVAAAERQERIEDGDELDFPKWPSK